MSEDDFGYYHVVPIDDLREHVTDGKICWCNPVLDEGVVIHNALDGRELIETGKRMVQ